MTSNYFSTTQVARICQVTPGSVIRWIKEGELESALTVGGHRRIPAVSLVKLIKKMGITVPAELSDLTGEPQTTQPRILIVDDEKIIRQMIRIVVAQKLPEAKIEEAENGFMAGWKTHSFHPDLVILDLLMPGLDGFRFCEFIRNLPEMKRTRIIAISGIQGFGYEEKIMKLGADVFMAKPFDNKVLWDKIEEQLQWARARKAK